jgi:crotonobetainyl-CoA:carnitine CoA-transferase CaiB-like acyl-CoA transferase
VNTLNGSQPLSGIKVLDFTQVMMGPCATQMLADYGADVIKVERPGAGDLSRTSLADDPEGLNNPVFRSLNRNKRSIALDLRAEAGKAIVYDLVKTADVVVNNFRAGVMDRMGFGYEALSRINPRIICAFGSGFGQTGPLAQATSGVMARKPDKHLPTTLYSTALADYSAGMHLVQGILLALMQREKTGVGQALSVSLYDSMLAMQMQEASMWLSRKRELNWGAFPLTGVFSTSDGALVLVGAFKANPLQVICRALDLPDLSADPRFANFEAQVEHKAELHKLFRSKLSTDTTAYWLAKLEEQDLLCAPVQTLGEALESGQTAANKMVIELNSMKLVASPITMGEGAFKLRHAPPTLNEHGGEVLAELGYSSDRIAELRKAKVLA